MNKGNIINKEDNLEEYGYTLRVGGNGAVNFAVGVQAPSYESGDCYPTCWGEVTTPYNTLQTGQTYHLVATYNGQMLIIYVDGFKSVFHHSSIIIILETQPNHCVWGISMVMTDHFQLE